MERNDRKGESAHVHPRPAGAQHNEMNNCQPSPGTPRSGARPAPTWEDIDNDIALRRGLVYLHACHGFDARGLPATSTALVDRPASDSSSTSAAKRGFWSDDYFDKTVEMTRPETENVQPAYRTASARQRSCYQRMLSPLRRRDLRPEIFVTNGPLDRTHLIAIACLGC